MNNTTTHNLLRKVIASAKLSVEENARLALNKNTRQGNFFDSDRIDLFCDESMGNINLDTEDQETLTEADDEALLNNL